MSIAAPRDLFPATSRVVKGIEELIGNTPMLQLPLEGGAPGTMLLTKLESANPMSSIKDRFALRMLRAAEESGELRAVLPELDVETIRRIVRVVAET